MPQVTKSGKGDVIRSIVYLTLYVIVIAGTAFVLLPDLWIIWLALAVATLWVVCVGGEADANLTASSLDHLPPTHIARRTKFRSSQPRLLSCFTRGLTVILSAIIRQDPISVGIFLPEPWPT